MVLNETSNLLKKYGSSWKTLLFITLTQTTQLWQTFALQNTVEQQPCKLTVKHLR